MRADDGRAQRHMARAAMHAAFGRTEHARLHRRRARELLFGGYASDDPDDPADSGHESAAAKLCARCVARTQSGWLRLRRLPF